MLIVAHCEQPPTTSPVAVAGSPPAVAFLLDWLDKHVDFGTIHAVGHRVVHGRRTTRPSASRSRWRPS